MNRTASWLATLQRVSNSTWTGWRRAVVLTAIATMAWACGGGDTTDPDPTVTNNPPVATGAIPDQTVHVAQSLTVDLSHHFNDPDGDALTYSAATQDANVATASVSGSNATLTGVSQGTTTVTSTATDMGGLSAQQSFAVNVPNRPPEPTGSIPDQALSVGDTVQFDVSLFFTDPDGDALSYDVATADESVAIAILAGSTIDVVALRSGTALVTITASDPGGMSAELSFSATIQQQGPSTVEFETGLLSAPEGGAVSLEITVAPAPDSTLVVGYTIGRDDDPGTDDASEADHNGGSRGQIRFEAGDSRKTFEITIQDDDDIEPTRETFAISLDPPQEGAGYVLGSTTTAIVTIDEGVCDRTPRVREALVALTRVDQCHEPDGSHLATIDTLDLRGPPTGDLATGVYARSTAGTGSVGCGAVTRSDLRAAGSALASETTSCASRTLGRTPLPPALYSRSAVSDEPITELRAGDFLELVELEYLWLFNNRLTELPAGIFSGLEELRQIFLANNRIRELPDGLLSGLSRLESFVINDNELTRLPPDLFTGLVRLREVWMSANQLAELPAGLFSDAGDLEELHLWGNRLRALPRDIFSGLVYLKGLFVGSNLLTEVERTAFSDLTDLESLGLGDNRVAELPVGLFANLGNLESLWIRKNRLENLQDGLFDALTNLQTLVADSNRIEKIEDGTFSYLSELDRLWLGHNRLSELRPGMFSGLGGLELLYLAGNRFASVEPGVFADLANLEKLWLGAGEIAQVHPGAFNGLSSLTILSLSENQLSALPDGVFAGLPLLEELWVYKNHIEELPENAFAGLPNLKILVMWNNRLTELPHNVFQGLEKLGGLHLSGNAITQLPPGVFSSLVALDTLIVRHNNLTELPDGLFKGLFDLDLFNATGNPAAPFGLEVRLERRDTTDLAVPGPAKVVLSLVEGAPFSIRIPLSVDGGTLSRDTAVIEQGHTASAVFTVTMSSGSQSGTTVVVGPSPPVPDAIRGVEVVAADTLVLFTASGDISAAEPDMATGMGDQGLERNGAAPAMSIAGSLGSARQRLTLRSTGTGATARTGCSAACGRCTPAARDR